VRVGDRGQGTGDSFNDPDILNFPNPTRKIGARFLRRVVPKRGILPLINLKVWG
jgi:hypothetical protein